MWFRLMVLSCLALAAFADLSKERSPATVRIHHERSTDSELVASVDAFGETHHLNLKETKLPAVPVHEVKLSPNGTIIINDVQVDNFIRYYEDDTTGALMYMTDDNVLEGLISDTIFLKYENNRHVAAKIDGKSSEPFCATEDHDENLGTDGNENLVIDGSENHGDNKALTYYPEIITLFDSAIYRRFGNNAKLVAYAVMYWKAVDKRFRTVQGASIYLRLAGIYYSRSTTVDKLFMDSSTSVFSTRKTLGEFMKNRRSSLRAHDISHLITGRDLCQSSSTCSVTGIVNRIGGACIYTSTRAENIGITEDDAFFSGTYTTAHEIAHNLGAWHDGQGNSRSCSWNWGYMMSYIRESFRTAYFSSCSSYSMRSIYYTSSGSCLRTISSGSYNWPSNWPGTSYSLDFQCTTRLGKRAYYYRQLSPNTHCYRLYCQYYSSGRWYLADTFKPALEGTPCGSGKTCSHGACRSA